MIIYRNTAIELPNGTISRDSWRMEICHDPEPVRRSTASADRKRIQLFGKRKQASETPTRPKRYEAENMPAARGGWTLVETYRDRLNRLYVKARCGGPACYGSTHNFPAGEWVRPRRETGSCQKCAAFMRRGINAKLVAAQRRALENQLEQVSA